MSNLTVDVVQQAINNTIPISKLIVADKHRIGIEYKPSTKTFSIIENDKVTDVGNIAQAVQQYNALCDEVMDMDK